MIQNMIGGYSSKVQVADNYVYTINLQSIEVRSDTGHLLEAYINDIDLGSSAINLSVTVRISDDLCTLVVSVPIDLVRNGISPIFDVRVKLVAESFPGISFDVPSSFKIGITSSELVCSNHIFFISRNSNYNLLTIIFN